MHELKKSTESSSVGKNIKSLRLSRKWKQKYVADKLGVSIPAFSKIETGVTDINLSRLKQIAEVFKISVAEVVKSESDDAITVEEMLVNVVEEPYVNALRRRVVEQDVEIQGLMRKIIELYEEIQMKKQEKNAADTKQYPRDIRLE